ncbi:putative protein OBERON [Helianthus annuus]|nr:putative protein OBERON [Helianthus annuus]
MGLESSLSAQNRLPTNEPIEEFLFKRCKNVNCKQLLTVEDCDCKICSTKKGLCSDGTQKNIIKPRQSLKGPAGTIEMEFNHLCCGHASEMFGFIKDVFKSCAEQWCMETLIKELE